MDKYRRDPWGNDSNNQPPDLDKIISNFFKRINFFGAGSHSPGGASGLKASSILIIAFVLFVVVWAASGFFIVRPAEEAVQLRFGKYQETLGPGPHWIPQFIDSYKKINVQRVDSFDFDVDLLTKSSSLSDKPKQIIKVEGTESNGNDDTDKNVVHVELSVQYRVVDPKQYLYNIVNGEKTLEEVAQSQLSEVVGTMVLNNVLTKGRDQVSIDVAKQTQTLMDQYQAGIAIVAVNVRKAQAPEEVADAFLDVVQAGQDEQRYIQQAQAYASKVVPIAEGVQSRILADANAYQEKIVLGAEADVASYLALLKVYDVAPKVTQKRLYLETMQDVLSHTGKVLVDTKDSRNLLYLPLDKLQGVNAVSNNQSVSTVKQVASHQVKASSGSSDMSAAALYDQWFQAKD